MTLYGGKNGVDVCCMTDVNGDLTVMASGKKTAMMELAREKNYAVCELKVLRYQQEKKQPKSKIPNCPWCKKDYGKETPLEWDQFKEVWVCRSHGSFDESQLKDGV